MTQSSSRPAVAGPAPGNELDDAKAGHAIAQIFRPAQECEHVLDVGGLQELEAAELDERNVAAGELDLERGAVMRGAEQHGLRLEDDAAFAVLQDLFRRIARLLGLVAHAHELRPLGRRAVRPQVLGEALLGEIDDGVGRREDGLGRAVVALERDDLGARTEVTGKIENVAHGRGAKRVDRLGVVADHGEALAVRLERQQDRGLQDVGVLILVDQHVIETLADLVGEQRHHLRPIEQQVVVVEHVLALLGLDIGGIEPPQLGFPVRAPGKERAEHLVERHLRIHDARIDREAGALGREARLGSRKAEIVPNEIQEIGGILAVMDGERPVEPDLRGVFADQPRADGVKGAGPGERIGHDGRARAQTLASQRPAQ